MTAALTMHTAEPFFIPGGKTGCLLLHGYTGTPKEMRMLAENLSTAGYTVLAPRLSAHAVMPEDLHRARWWDWMASVEDGLNLLKGCTDRQVVMGLSMGGALALLAAARFSPSAVVSFSTPWRLGPDPRLRYLPLLSLVYPDVHKGKPDWHNPEAANDHKEYPYYPTRSLIELDHLLKTMWAELVHVTAPVLFVQSRNDHVISPESMDQLFESVSSQIKQKVWVEDSGHVVIREPEREKVFTETRQFLSSLHLQP